MKRKSFIIALIAFAAVTAAIGSAVASLTSSVDATVYVRLDEANATPLKNIGTYPITIDPLGSGTVTIGNLTDTRPNPDIIVSRIARDSNGVPLTVATSTTVNAPNGTTIN